MRIATLFGFAAALAAGGCTGEMMATDEGEDTEGTAGINIDEGNDNNDEFGDGIDEESDDGPDLGDKECERIDFVFVVDNSLSMEDEQAHLVAAVPGFVDAMQNALPDVKDIRVGVVDTDAYPGVGDVDPLDACPSDADCGSCDYQLGAFQTRPNSSINPSDSCNFSSGGPYMDGLSENFAAEFECAAIVGTQGNPIEQQAAALTEALAPEMNAEGACNEGFVRDNALLVFLMISDEEDDFEDPPKPQGGSLGDPGRWHDAVLDAKKGKETNVVALGLIGGSPRFSDCTALSTDLNGAEQTTRLQKFIDSFETNFSGSVCTNGYDAFFNQALETVSEGCKFFIP